MVGWSKPSNSASKSCIAIAKHGGHARDVASRNAYSNSQRKSLTVPSCLCPLSSHSRTGDPPSKRGSSHPKVMDDPSLAIGSRLNGGVGTSQRALAHTPSPKALAVPRLPAVGFSEVSSGAASGSLVPRSEGALVEGRVGARDAVSSAEELPHSPMSL